MKTRDEMLDMAAKFVDSSPQEALNALRMASKMPESTGRPRDKGALHFFDVFEGDLKKARLKINDEQLRNRKLQAKYDRLKKRYDVLESVMASQAVNKALDDVELMKAVNDSFDRRIATMTKALQMKRNAVIDAMTG